MGNIKELSKALYSKASGSSFLSAVGSRFYEQEAPDGTDYLYATYMIVSQTPDRVFAGGYEDTLIQISIFDNASSSAAIKDAYEHEKTLYDECLLSIVGQTLIWMAWENTVPLREEHTTDDGTQRVWAYHTTYRLTVEV